MRKRGRSGAAGLQREDHDQRAGTSSSRNVILQFHQAATHTESQAANAIDNGGAGLNSLAGAPTTQALGQSLAIYQEPPSIQSGAGLGMVAGAPATQTFGPDQAFDHDVDSTQGGDGLNRSATTPTAGTSGQSWARDHVMAKAQGGVGLNRSAGSPSARAAGQYQARDREAEWNGVHASAGSGASVDSGRADTTPAGLPAQSRHSVGLSEAAEPRASRTRDATTGASSQLGNVPGPTSESAAIGGNDRMSQRSEDSTDEWFSQGEGFLYTPEADDYLEDLMPTLRVERVPRRETPSTTLTGRSSVAHQRVAPCSYGGSSSSSSAPPIVGAAGSGSSPMSPLPGIEDHQVERSDHRPDTRASSAAVPVGSRGHSQGRCRPCAHFWKPGGCSKGDDCERCHLCDQDAFKRYREEYRAKLQREKHLRWRRASGQSGAGDDGTQEPYDGSPHASHSFHQQAPFDGRRRGH